jgi:hypothetical protein
MIQPPNIPELVAETARIEQIENTFKDETGNRLYRDPNLLPEVSKALIKQKSEVAGVLTRGYKAVASKKCKRNNSKAFVEIQADDTWNAHFDQDLVDMTDKMGDGFNLCSKMKIGVVFAAT